MLTNIDTKKTGVIILGHGSKVKAANATIPKVIRELKKKRGIDIVEPAYLQLCKPSLCYAIKKVTGLGCKKIIIVPFFLFIGNHVKRDIPKLIAQESRLYKDVEFVYARNLGQDPRLSDIVLDCIKEALLK